MSCLNINFVIILFSISCLFAKAMNDETWTNEALACESTMDSIQTHYNLHGPMILCSLNNSYFYSIEHSEESTIETYFNRREDKQIVCVKKRPISLSHFKKHPIYNNKIIDFDVLFDKDNFSKDKHIFYDDILLKKGVYACKPCKVFFVFIDEYGEKYQISYFMFPVSKSPIDEALLYIIITKLLECENGCL